MVTKKTGVLYGAAAAIGSLLAGGTEAQTEALYRYGCNIGAAFQIQDDLIDLLMPAEKSGKDQASDIREGKQTLIAITAREQGIDLRPWQRALSHDEVSALIEMLTGAGVLASVQQNGESMIESAVTGLSVLPDSDEKGLLSALAWYFIRRDY